MAELYYFMNGDCIVTECDVLDVNAIVTALKKDGAEHIHVEYLEE